MRSCCSPLFCEANQCIDALANYGCLMDPGTCFFHVCPNNISLLFFDLIGNSTPCMMYNLVIISFFFNLVPHCYIKKYYYYFFFKNKHYFKLLLLLLRRCLKKHYCIKVKYSILVRLIRANRANIRDSMMSRSFLVVYNLFICYWHYIPCSRHMLESFPHSLHLHMLHIILLYFI